MDNQQVLAVMMYQLMFAEEARLEQACIDKKRIFDQREKELDCIAYFRACCEREYQQTLAKKVFDILKSLDYN